MPLNLDRICSKYVTPDKGAAVPNINAVIAGYTDRQSTRFLAANGVRNIETKEIASTDNMVCFYSCTKSMTAMAILILWESGQVELDSPAKTYLPILANFGIIREDQVDPETGDLKFPLQKPNHDIKIRQLLLHTSGFAYIITDSNYFAIMCKKRLFTPLMKMFEPAHMPLLFEPGTNWVYGHSFDWLGLIVEAVSGKKLSIFLHENIFSKAEMTSCTFHMNEPSKMVSLHNRTEGLLKVHKKNLPVPLTAEIDMGGHGCFGTVSDYLKFLRIWLNYGLSPDTGTRILSTKTVEYAVRNHLPSNISIDFPIPFSDLDHGYSLIGCGYSGKASRTGRPAGALFWAGLANLYFWIDMENGCAGFWGCQIMPYMEKHCVRGFEEFETAVYKDYLSQTTKL